jgi:hypothetical protein
LKRSISLDPRGFGLTIDLFDVVISLPPTPGSWNPNRCFRVEVVIIVARAIEAKANVHVLDVLDQHTAERCAVKGRAGSTPSLKTEIGFRNRNARPSYRCL